MPDLLAAGDEGVLLTPDGCVTGIASWAQEPDSCCLPPQCINPCDTACDLVELLPQGPMWNKQKAQALEWLHSFNRAPWDLCRPIVECDPPLCPSLAQFAIFMSQYVATMIDSTLWASVRESDPFTAVTTLDQWKERLGYQDCFLPSCRANFRLSDSQFEIDGELCFPVLPEELQCALDHAIVSILTRMRVDGIHNLCYINWILEPLNVRIEPHCECDPDLDGPCEEEDCCDAKYKLCTVGCTIPACPPLNCYDTEPKPPVAACIQYECLPEFANDPPEPPIFLNLELAMCLVRVYFPECPSVVYECPDDPPECECWQVARPEDPSQLPGCGPRPPRRINDLCGTP